ncbi:MAG: helix-turn-helix domain-containing protein [Cyanobacteria bacterium TGS_CYA1]|nr:helix-turn-helix domain-containing protein [Cyanobacteria bacterium TGS_CYA1]
MSNKKKQTDAMSILRSKYIASDSKRESELEKERLNAKVARLIFDYREEAGLTQKQLAELVGTTQSVISRLEDADYDGHSLTMLERIANALNRKLSIDMEDEKPAQELHHAFQKLLYLSRLKKDWSLEKAAEKIGITSAELYYLERSSDCHPSPFVLYQLSQAYEVPQEKLAFLAGAFKQVPDELRHEASRFAAQSDSFDKITPAERKLLDGFIKILKTKF